jgi:hypothetical protein
MFTVNVPKGKADKNLFCINKESRYLNIPPIKLPMPISKIIFIKSCLLILILKK